VTTEGFLIANGFFQEAAGMKPSIENAQMAADCAWSIYNQCRGKKCGE
jgi:hypothetical protein